jgi:hypothetical protein
MMSDQPTPKATIIDLDLDLDFDLDLDLDADVSPVSVRDITYNPVVRFPAVRHREHLDRRARCGTIQ